MHKQTEIHPTFIRKDTRGAWSATSTYQIPGSNKHLRISTSKNFNGDLVTRATAHTLEGGFETHAMYSDFSERLMGIKVRVTAKTVEEQHAAVLVDDVMERAVAFYAAKGK